MVRFNSDEVFKIGTSDEMIRYMVKIFETGDRIYFPACSKLKGTYIYGFLHILDCKGLNNSILKLKFINFMRELSKLPDYYPENLSALYAINTGIVFRSFYSAVKIFLNDTIKSKIKVFGEDYKDALLQIIDKENLPKMYGGTCKCPEGCLFSNAGPWKNSEDKEEIPEDILQKRKELNDFFESGKIANS